MQQTDDAKMEPLFKPTAMFVEIVQSQGCLLSSLRICQEENYYLEIGSFSKPRMKPLKNVETTEKCEKPLKNAENR